MGYRWMLRTLTGDVRRGDRIAQSVLKGERQLPRHQLQITKPIPLTTDDCNRELLSNKFHRGGTSMLYFQITIDDDLPCISPQLKLWADRADLGTTKTKRASLRLRCS
jgi:hypothetical protein